MLMPGFSILCKSICFVPIISVGGHDMLMLCRPPVPMQGIHGTPKTPMSWTYFSMDTFLCGYGCECHIILAHVLLWRRKRYANNKQQTAIFSFVFYVRVQHTKPLHHHYTSVDRLCLYELALNARYPAVVDWMITC